MLCELSLLACEKKAIGAAGAMYCGRTRRIQEGLSSEVDFASLVIRAESHSTG